LLDEETRDVLQEVADMAGTIGDEAPVERYYHQHEVGTLFDRCRGMFAAVLALLDGGFVQEAGTFCRPLFVDSLALAEIAAADEKRRTRRHCSSCLNPALRWDTIRPPSRCSHSYEPSVEQASAAMSVRAQPRGPGEARKAATL
jgi:hypothetical protein